MATLKLSVSELAKLGNVALVDAFITDDPQIEADPSYDRELQLQLYRASFWGLLDQVSEALARGTNPNVSNAKTKWTPLHAAAFQEHGAVVMALLDAGANPLLADARGFTPADFASVSDRIWPQFSFHQCVRRSRRDLIAAGLLREITQEASQPQSAGPKFLSGSSHPSSGPAHGDVLADTAAEPRGAGGFRLW